MSDAGCSGGGPSRFRKKGCGTAGAGVPVGTKSGFGMVRNLPDIFEMSESDPDMRARTVKVIMNDNRYGIGLSGGQSLFGVFFNFAEGADFTCFEEPYYENQCAQNHYFTALFLHESDAVFSCVRGGRGQPDL